MHYRHHAEAICCEKLGSQHDVADMTLGQMQEDETPHKEEKS